MVPLFSHGHGLGNCVSQSLPFFIVFYVIEDTGKEDVSNKAVLGVYYCFQSTQFFNCSSDPFLLSIRSVKGKSGF